MIRLALCPQGKMITAIQYRRGFNGFIPPNWPTWNNSAPGASTGAWSISPASFNVGSIVIAEIEASRVTTPISLPSGYPSSFTYPQAYCLYICTAAITNSATAPWADTGHWQSWTLTGPQYGASGATVKNDQSQFFGVLMPEINQSVGVWTAGTAYAQGNIVTIGSGLAEGADYICVAGTTGSTPPDQDAAHWALWQEEWQILPDQTRTFFGWQSQSVLPSGEIDVLTCYQAGSGFVAPQLHPNPSGSTITRTFSVASKDNPAQSFTGNNPASADDAAYTFPNVPPGCPNIGQTVPAFMVDLPFPQGSFTSLTITATEVSINYFCGFNLQSGQAKYCQQTVTLLSEYTQAQCQADCAALLATGNFNTLAWGQQITLGYNADGSISTTPAALGATNTQTVPDGRNGAAKAVVAQASTQLGYTTVIESTALIDVCGKYCLGTNQVKTGSNLFSTQDGDVDGYAPVTLAPPAVEPGYNSAATVMYLGTCATLP